MRLTALFFGYLFVCLLLAALLTYPVMATGWIDHDPQRVMGRLAQIFILLGLWPFLKRLHLADRAALGYSVPWPVLRGSIGSGWLRGVAMLLVLSIALILLGIRTPDADLELWPYLAKKALQALLGGLLIGVLEETFFRGALFSAIRRQGSLVTAVLGTSFLYMLVHFMKPSALPAGMAFDWSGAAWMFGAVFVDAVQWRQLDSMVALFMVGVLLALVRERTGHIGWGIGLHAGWVFVIQVTRRMTDANPESPLGFLVGTYDGIIGWLAVLWIGIITALYWLWWSQPAPRAAPGSPP
ncbi:CPBP family intramembrane metalloprotease domain-containing protein [Thiocapsa imhoffii]|uniref:CPBP family intramembrane metalloprotease domain-containing protein n=2 Tax=Thiocapsa imhoffii TaxID=382777 RepID=A0A9X0WES5_9GAMM|nr:CPBP family intramembrane glutamic endopeptidase [Thiocapsa imhoffii]MBK1643180.1 CPBP family intramembrane metalloprotease domain-containing protein [Thiocapsa imhoffii]